MKKHIGYKFIDLYQIVVKWVKAQIKELVEKKIGLGTKVEQNDFKVMVK